MLKASFSYQIYSNGDFSVNKFLVKECTKDDFCDQGDIITVLGNNVPIHKKIVYLLEGAWEQNKKKKKSCSSGFMGIKKKSQRMETKFWLIWKVASLRALEREMQP